jgi:DNA-binding NtrC family response regulator
VDQLGERRVRPVAEPEPFARIVGRTPAARALKALLVKIAAADAPTVLLVGETGTGKGLIAREIHEHGPRAGARFQDVSCSAVPETLLESELFGHEAGAFTDARRRKLGIVELADGGTLFLDEIGEMRPLVQVKLLGFLEQRAFRRVGGIESLDVDVAVVAATHRDLDRAVAEGSFRPDLYYRLHVVPVRVPPLRDRIADLPLLVDHFIEPLNAKLGKEVRGVSPEALERLAAHEWPGNIRELRNLVEGAMLLAEGEELELADFLAFRPRLRSIRRYELPREGVDLARLEADLMRQALARTGGNQCQAADLLGLTRHQLRYRMQKHGLES